MKEHRQFEEERPDLFPAGDAFFEKKRQIRLSPDNFELPPLSSFFKEPTWAVSSLALNTLERRVLRVPIYPILVFRLRLRLHCNR
jgi:hypothetical protein